MQNRPNLVSDIFRLSHDTIIGRRVYSFLIHPFNDRARSQIDVCILLPRR